MIIKIENIALTKKGGNAETRARWPVFVAGDGKYEPDGSCIHRCFLGLRRLLAGVEGGLEIMRPNGDTI